MSTTQQTLRKFLLNELDLVMENFWKVLENSFIWGVREEADINEVGNKSEGKQNYKVESIFKEL